MNEVIKEIVTIPYFWLFLYGVTEIISKKS